MKLPQLVIKQSCPNLWQHLPQLVIKNSPVYDIIFAPICNKLLSKLVYFAISRVPWTTATKLGGTIKQYAL